MSRRRVHSPRSRWSFVLGLLAVLTAVVALPAAVIYAVRAFKADGPRAQLVHVERSFYSTDGADPVEYLELRAGHNCMLGVHSSGAEYLLVFENDERAELSGNEITVGPVLHRPQHDPSEPNPSAPAKTGHARTGDLVAIDSGFEPGQIWDWKTRPHEECERDDIALVVPR